METLENISVGDMPNSQFLRPLRMLFKQDGRERFCDLLTVHDSVAVLIFNTTRNVFVFVKQFRPAVFHNQVSNVNKNSTDPIKWEDYPAKLGITLELCAGILDNPKLKENEIAKQEVLEECGYDAPLENFKFIKNFRSLVSAAGSSSSLFYVEVTDNMKKTQGGGMAEEGELIDVIEMSFSEVDEYVSQETILSPGGFLYAINWFKMNKLSNILT